MTVKVSSPTLEDTGSLFAFVQQISTDQLKHHVRAGSVESKATSQSAASARPLTAQILIAGAEMELMFRVHFTMEDAEDLAVLRLGESPESRALAIDLIRELSNLISGRIKALLEGSNIAMAQGLPFVLGGSNYATAIQGSTASFVWGLWVEHRPSLLCSMTLEIKTLRREKN